MMENIDIPIMSSYFDESVFIDGWVFKNARNAYPISVFNRADSFILKTVHNISVIETCQIGDNAYSLNPINPCARVNIYSLDNRHSSTHNVYPRTLITVIHDSAIINLPIRKIDLVSLIDETCVYDANPDLSSLESAIMLKFYSLQIANSDDAYPNLNNRLYITATLYHKVMFWFESDKHPWFYFDRSNISIRNVNGEYIYKNSIINDPSSVYLPFYENALY